MFVAMKTMDGQDPMAKDHYETMRTSKGGMATPPLELSICVPDNIGQILVEALRADPSKTLGDIVTVVPTLRDGTLIRLMQDGAMVFVGPYPCQFPNESVWAAAAKDKTLSLPVELRISTLRRMPLSSCCGNSPLVSAVINYELLFHFFLRLKTSRIEHFGFFFVRGMPVLGRDDCPALRVCVVRVYVVRTGAGDGCEAQDGWHKAVPCGNESRRKGCAKSCRVCPCRVGQA